MRIGRLLRLLIIFCLANVISACVVPMPTQNINEHNKWEQELSSGNKSLVFGRIQWIEHGKETKIGKGLFAFSISPTIFRMEDKSKTRGSVDENGAFVWALEPGLYVINTIDYHYFWSEHGDHSIVPKVAFRVPVKGKIYYIGTLRVDFASKHNVFSGDLYGQMKVTIEDQGQRDNPAIAENQGLMPKDVEKSLMVHDVDLPYAIDTTEQLNKTQRILNYIFRKYFIDY